MPDITEGATLLYSGITKSTALDAGDAAKILKWCELARIAELHAYLKRYAAMDQGLDAYCPLCGRLYCRKHYLVTEEWTDGTYEGSFATCPLGHRRIIDD